ncbi:hypothetical protein A8144_03915 [Mycobacterium leprae 3125609]|uniref:Uncharacterized protein n=1 Tax=Mycobacterium leprae TaxID=1769 RepID=O32946_MYCLR|nr:hypothetical protein A8144_03915 [Mycobacterium leprae 3125609]OAX71915.1 hypothetical protein A3216_02955 [Mycobacterium leprae 7935681]CAB11334.1 hypothetical protein MLCB2052.36 [Mycobacterium leprae]
MSTLSMSVTPYLCDAATTAGWVRNSSPILWPLVNRRVRLHPGYIVNDATGSSDNENSTLNQDFACAVRIAVVANDDRESIRYRAGVVESRDLYNLFGSSSSIKAKTTWPSTPWLSRRIVTAYRNSCSRGGNVGENIRVRVPVIPHPGKTYQFLVTRHVYELLIAYPSRQRSVSENTSTKSNCAPLPSKTRCYKGLHHRDSALLTPTQMSYLSFA